MKYCPNATSRHGAPRQIFKPGRSQKPFMIIVRRTGLILDTALLLTYLEALSYFLRKFVMFCRGHGGRGYGGHNSYGGGYGRGYRGWHDHSGH